MTYTRMVEALSQRTGVPKSVVRHVLDAQCDLMRSVLAAQSEVHFREVLKISAAPRKMKVPGEGQSFEEIERVTLRVRPMRRFRKELNRWTSSES